MSENNNKPISTDDLLKNLSQLNKKEKIVGRLENTKETWSRIGKKDSFSELGLSSDDLQEFLQDWIEENPYQNI